MSENREIQVILGSGPLGQAVLHGLIRRGKRVQMVNTSGKRPDGVPTEVEISAANLYDPGDVHRVTQDAAVVYHTAQPLYHQWPEKFPPLQKSIINGLSGRPGGQRLVMGDNLYMYGPVNGPIHEGLPYAASNHKGTARKQVAEMLLAAHQAGDIRAVIGRGSDFFGPGVGASAVGASVFTPLVRGKAANVLGDPDLPHTYTYIEDFGEALVVLGEHEEAYGQAWHTPNSETLTTRQFVQIAAEALGKKPKIIAATPQMMRILGVFVPDIRDMIEMAYEFTEPFVVDDQKYKQAFGDHSTPIREAICVTAEWWKGRKGD